jgi:uncharacterized protein YwgA
MMTRYQLAKLVEWAETLHSRKRLQKVVFLLQSAGCPLEADFTLHYFGPYSQDVANLADEMTQAGLLEEKQKETGIGKTFHYSLADKTKGLLSDFEQSSKGQNEVKAIASFKSQAFELMKADLKELEYAATLVFFRQRKMEWDEAIDKTCQFKKLRKNSVALRRAKELAEEIVE